MEVTRQLRRERVDKKGLAPIQLTCCWDGQRLRLPSGNAQVTCALHSVNSLFTNTLHKTFIPCCLFLRG